MIPTSDVRSSLPSAADCAEMARLLDQKYADARGPRAFEISLSKDTQGIYARVLLRNERGTFYYPVEGRIANRDHDLSERDAAVLVLDFIDSYFEEYFREGGDLMLPIDWAEYQWDGTPLQLRGQVINLEAEQLADELLGAESGVPGRKDAGGLH